MGTRPDLTVVMGAMAGVACQGRHKACPYRRDWAVARAAAGKGQAQGLPLRWRCGRWRGMGTRPDLTVVMGAMAGVACQGRHKACPYRRDWAVARGLLREKGRHKACPYDGVEGVGMDA